eukprot:Nk52_evm16s1992 gene=Nk52_evmTU16s1992
MSSAVDNLASKKSSNHKGLPESVTQLVGRDGSEVYIVSVCHVSKSSCEDVQKTMELVKPHCVVLELCKSRKAILTQKLAVPDGDVGMSMSAIVSAAQSGGGAGLGILLLTTLVNKCGAKMKISQGQEQQEGLRSAVKQNEAFLKTWEEAGKPPVKEYNPEQGGAPYCPVLLGDRDMMTTILRAYRHLPLLRKIRLFFELVFSFGEEITEEDIDFIQSQDGLDEALSLLTKKYPELVKYLIEERDQYLTKSIKSVAKGEFYKGLISSCSPQIERGSNCLVLPRAPSFKTSSSTGKPVRVVAVIGAGHVRGIVEEWEKEQPPFDELETIPLGTRQRYSVVYTAAKWITIGFIAYRCFRRFAK